MRLLLVEDEAKLSQLLKRHLEREAFAVDVTSDGAAALAWARENQYDCLRCAAAARVDPVVGDAPVCVEALRYE